MPRKPIMASKGFLTRAQVAKRARAFGIAINLKTLQRDAKLGKIPFAEAIPGREKSFQFPEEKLKQVISAATKKALLPKGSTTKTGLAKYAKKRGLLIHPASVDAYISRMNAGLEPLAEGLASDRFGAKRRMIIPENFAARLLSDAKLRKGMPVLLKSGELVRLSQLATQLGLKERSLHARKDIAKLRIGTAAVVTKEEAARFKKFYLQSGRGPVKKGSKQKPAAKPGLQKQAKVLEARKPAKPSQQTFEKYAFRQIRKLKGALSNERRSIIRSNLAGEIRERERRINEAKVALLREKQKQKEKGPKKKKKFTPAQLLELSRLDLQMAKLEMLAALLEGESIGSPKAQSIAQRINDLERRVNLLERRK